MMLKFNIKPYDVLFFGSGRPFNLGDVATSVFPPFPHTVAGAISSLIGSSAARVLKRVFGPFLFNQKENALYFPKPSDIYNEKKKKSLDKVYILKPAKVTFNLFNPENTNKPEEIEEFALLPRDVNVAPFEGFISSKGLSEWLTGKEVDAKEIKSKDEIFTYENRLGIFRDAATHTVTREDGLYRINMVRMENEWELVCWVEFSERFEEKEIMRKIDSIPRAIKLGGEMKTASYNFSKDNRILNLFKKPEVKDGDIVKLIFLTPGVYEEFIPPLEGLKVKAIINTGYINMGLHSPKKLGKYRTIKKALPAGTVLYCEVKNADSLSKLWLSPSEGDNDFIGSNLMIYGRV